MYYVYCHGNIELNMYMAQALIPHEKISKSENNAQQCPYRQKWTKTTTKQKYALF